MKKAVIMCILLLIVAAGCIKVQDTEPSGSQSSDVDVDVQETVEQPGIEDKPKAEGYSLGNEARAMIESQMTAGKDVIFPQTFQRLKYGESYVFGIGVNNLGTQEDEFLVSVKFKEAYARYQNKIDADEASVNEWVKTVFSPFKLGPYKNQIMGIAVEVGDMMPGVKPAAGTYVFDVQVYHRISPGAGEINSEYASKQTLSVKVD